MNSKLGEDVLDRVVKLAGKGEVTEECLGGSGGREGEGGDMSLESGEERFDAVEEFGKGVCGSAEMVGSMRLMGMGISRGWRMRRQRRGGTI